MTIISNFYYSSGLPIVVV